MSLPRRFTTASLVAALTVGAALVQGQGQPQAPAPSPSPSATPPATVGGIAANYDESKVGSYTLPDPLVTNDGKRVKDARTWREKRRPEIVRLFEEHQFGKSPGRPKPISFDVQDKGTSAFDGRALRKQVTVYFGADKAGPKMDLLVYLPKQQTKPVPLLLSLSFSANSSLFDDRGIKPGEIWGREKTRVPAGTAKVTKLDITPFLDRGIGFATVYYGDIDPDFEGGIPNGVRSLFTKAKADADRSADEWGAIGAWAWGLSRAIDYLETDKAVDAKRIAILGHSRLGKTVLWAGAIDTRIAMVIATCSGEGGASLSRRNYGETVKHLNNRFPYWFARNYLKYGADVQKLPVDSHMLMALIAPRPLLLTTGDGDQWADPKGEFLAAVAAGPVYELLGKQGLDTGQWPPAGQAVVQTIGYRMHAGGHAQLPEDWALFLSFMDRHLLGSNGPTLKDHAEERRPNAMRAARRR